MNLGRHSIVVIAAWIGLSLTFAAQAQQANPARPLAGRTITVVEPFGTGSITESVMRILKPGMEKALGAKIGIRTERSPDGTRAFDRVAAARPDGLTLLAITDAARLFFEFLTGAPTRIEQLTPIAKLTDGVSLALVAPASSSIRDYDSLKAMIAAKKRPSLALYGAGSPAAVFAAMVEAHAHERFGERFTETDPEILARIATGTAEFGILPTPALMGKAGRVNKLRGIATSGAKRHPGLPDVPTLGEMLGTTKFAFTLAAILYAPPNVPGTIADALTSAVASAAESAEAKAAAQAMALPLAFRDAGVLRATMTRTKRVIRELIRP